MTFKCIRIGSIGSTDSTTSSLDGRTDEFYMPSRSSLRTRYSTSGSGDKFAIVLSFAISPHDTDDDDPYPMHR